MEPFLAKKTDVMSHPVNEDEGIFVPKLSKTITKYYIKMHFLEGVGRAREGITLLSLRNSGEFSKGWDWVAAIYKFGIFCCHAEVGVIVKLPIPKQFVDHVSGEVLCGVGSIRGVPWANVWWRHGILWEE